LLTLAGMTYPEPDEPSSSSMLSATLLTLSARGQGVGSQFSHTVLPTTDVDGRIHFPVWIQLLLVH